MKLKPLMLILALLTLWMTGCSKETEGEEADFPPTRIGLFTVNGTDYEMEAGGYKWERKKGLQMEVVQTDHAGPYQMADNISPIAAEPNQKVEIKVEKDPEIAVYLITSNGREKEISLDDNQLTVPSNKGKYIYEVLAKWKNGEVTYTFVLEVQ